MRVLVGVLDGVSVKVLVGVGVLDGVMDGVSVKVFVAVLEGTRVRVKDGVRVAGWNGVLVAVPVSVAVGVNVSVGVLVGEPVTTGGVLLDMAVCVSALGVALGVGVASLASGAKERKTIPAQ